MMTEMDILNGFVGKIISDCIDISVNAIRKADKNRKSKNQTMETMIYQVTVDALNAFPYNKYKKDEKVYEAAECILNELKRENGDYKGSVKLGLNMLSAEITGDICEDFLELLCFEICKGENRDLAIGYIIHQGERISEQQQQMDRHMKEEFEEGYKNEKEILEEVSGVKSLIKEMNGEKGYKTDNKVSIVNRVDEYAKKWDENVFLNDFNEEDEDAGVNIKLREIYVEECLPYYIWKTNSNPSKKTLRDKLKEYIIDKQSRKMLLILGQAGIGKSTLITWIMANLVEKKKDVFVYQFAADLDKIDWQGNNILNDIFNVIGLEYDKLENKTLILDGFDEIYVGENRERILNKLNQELKRRNILKKFSLIITCRENYIYDLQNIKCDYIVLQPWNETQIGIFCRAYWEKCGNEILEDKILKIKENKEIFGIPLILYMILALNVDIEKSSSKMDIYDQVFSLKKGGIYNRCYDTEHRINSPEIKEHIHHISQRIAFWMFENSADKAFISQEKFEEICNDEMNELGKRGVDIQSDTLIGNFFKLKHCEGIKADELQFVHRSIYEYFVALYFFEIIHNLSSKEEIAGELGELLKDGHLTKQILDFIKSKFDSVVKNNILNDIKEIFNMMLRDGMSYHMKKKHKNIVDREMNIFLNMLEIVHLNGLLKDKFDDKIISYLQYNTQKGLNLEGILLENVDLSGIYLENANLKYAYLKGVNLKSANLKSANLEEAYLEDVNLEEANLKFAHLGGKEFLMPVENEKKLKDSNLKKTNLKGACLNGAYLGNRVFKRGKFRREIYISSLFKLKIYIRRVCRESRYGFKDLKFKLKIWLLKLK